MSVHSGDTLPPSERALGEDRSSQREGLWDPPESRGWGSGFRGPGRLATRDAPGDRGLEHAVVFIDDVEEVASQRAGAPARALAGRD